MANYARRLSQDVSGQVRFDAEPPFPALVTWQKDNAVTSSVISLSPNTVEIEVGAINGEGVVIRWIPLTETAAVGARGSVVASGATANFDFYVSANTLPRRFIVPRETGGQVAGGQIGSVNGLYQRLAWINAGTSASSILATEY